MVTGRQRVCAAAAAAVAGLLFTGTVPAVAQQMPAIPSAGPWDAEVASFEAEDRATPPPSGAVLFVGSSSIRLWDLAKFFPGITTLNRGISGSQLHDVVRYAERIVIPYAPRVVVVYAGDNDINGGSTSEQVAVQFERLVRIVRTRLPDTRFVFIGIKPSLQRWASIERIRLANALIRAFATHDDGVAFVDVDQAMLGWDDQPRPELFVPDGLHLTAEGYQLWSTLLRPLLTASPAARVR